MNGYQFKYNFVITCFLLITFINSPGFAQSLSGLEEDYFRLLNKYQESVNLLDSTTKKYNNEINRIETEKNKKPVDDTEIARLMAEAVLTSDSLDILQENIDAIKNSINERKHILNSVYSQRIDSLKNLESDKNYTGNRAVLNVEVLSLIEKRLLVRPQISTLSYNPKELVKLTSSAQTDSSNKSLLNDYVTSALREVNIQIEQIAKMTDRIEEVLSLQDKVKDFVEESGMQTNISRFSSSVQYPTSSDAKYRNPGAEVGNNVDFANDAVNIIPQARTFSILFDQLNLNDNLSKRNPAKWSEYLNASTGYISLKDYLHILHELKSRLQDYRNILEKRLSD